MDQAIRILSQIKKEKHQIEDRIAFLTFQTIQDHHHQ